MAGALRERNPQLKKEVFMSVARGGMNGGHFYANVASPICVNCNFVVDPANANGLGVRSVKSNGWVRNVFMHTSATPGIGDKMTNPNPAAGVALIQFKQNFNYYLGGFSGFVTAVASPTTAVTSGLSIGSPYIITVLGNTTLAEWQTIGLPAGLTPTVGQSFIAIATGTGGAHTGKVGIPSPSGIISIEVIGDPNASIANSSIAVNGGAFVMVQFQAPTITSVTNAWESPLIATAPTTGSVCGMTFFFDGSSVTVDGI